MEVHLVGESIKFMILGMGVVFVFLYALVLLMELQAYIINRYFPDEDEVQSNKGRDSAEDDESARVAAIVAAVMEYRKNGGK